jgi:hypothetical protein
MVSKQRAIDIYEYCEKYGYEEGCRHFNLALSTIKVRYVEGKRYLGLTNPGSEKENAEEKIFPTGEEKRSYESFKRKQEFKQQSNEATITFIHEGHITNIEELIADRKVDLNIWNVDSHELKQWECAMKLVNATYDSRGKVVTKTTTPTTIPLYGITAKLTKIKPDVQICPVLIPVLFVITNPIEKVIIEHKSQFKKTLIFADSQMGFLKNQMSGDLVPFQDRQVLDVILQVAKMEQPDEIILNGDMIDCTEASSYAKRDQFYFTFQPAINEFGWLLTQLRNTCPQSKIVWILGNHEQRLDRVMNEHMVYAYQLKAYRDKYRVMSWRNLLSLDDLDVEIIEDYPGGEYWINNALRVIHGNFINIKKELERSNVSTIQSHIHIAQILTRTGHGRNGTETKSVLSTPCTCKTDGTVPGKTNHPDWNKGFTFVTSSENRFNQENVLIVNGKCIWRGQLIEGVDYTDQVDKLIKEI